MKVSQGFRIPNRYFSMNSNTSSICPGRYRHFKGGEYEVLGTATHSETYEKLVVYRPLYNETGLWVRPLAMFLESVNHEGKVVSRFTRIGEALAPSGPPG